MEFYFLLPPAEEKTSLQEGGKGDRSLGSAILQVCYRPYSGLIGCEMDRSPQDYHLHL